MSENDDTASLATGGEVTAAQAFMVGEHACTHCGCHLPPQTVTVNVHGTLPSTEEIVQRVIADLRRYRGFGG